MACLSDGFPASPMRTRGTQLPMANLLVESLVYRLHVQIETLDEQTTSSGIGAEEGD